MFLDMNNTDRRDVLIMRLNRLRDDYYLLYSRRISAVSSSARDSIILLQDKVRDEITDIYNELERTTEIDKT